MSLRLAQAAFLLLASCLTVRGAEIVVDPGGGGHFTTIGEAFEVAADGDTITVNPGTYTGEMNRDITWGERNLVLRAGTASALGGPGRGPEIDLEGQGRFLLLLSDTTDTTSVISGLDVTGGIARDFPDDGGGAILAQNASPKIVSCKFSDCDGGFGGAIKLLYSDGRVRSCTFSSNSADDGGGLHVAYGAEAIVEGCTFVGNTAALQGGAMRFYQAVRVVRSCTIVGNASPDGGGIALLGGSAPSIERTIIAFSPEGAALYGNPPANVVQSIIYGNAGGDAPLGRREDVLNVDPLLCDIFADDFTLCENSQALPENNSWDVLVGAHGEGCPPCETEVEASSWGVIKALYRSH